MEKVTHYWEEKIIAAQIFSVKKVTTATDITYTCNSLDYFLRNGHDINGIFSVSYKLPRQRDNTFNVIRDSYLIFVADGSEETEKTLINLLETEKASLTAELQKISSSSAVTLEDCCTARLLIIYTAFLKMLKKMIPVQTAKFERADRTATGHRVTVTYQAGLWV